MMQIPDCVGAATRALAACAEQELSPAVNLCLSRGMPRELVAFFLVNYAGFHFASSTEQKVSLAFVLDQPACLLATDDDLEWIVASLLEFGTTVLEEVWNVRPS